MIKILSFYDSLPENSEIVNTTSRSKNWSIELSPFFVGPIELYDGYIAKNLENAWQFSKLYPEMAENNLPTEKYWNWAKNGWGKSFAHRYPVGKNKKPLGSWWKNELLDYIESRKKIYIPLYAKAVKKTSAFSILQNLYKDCKINNKTLCLLDFDAYDHNSLCMTYRDVIHCQNKKMGHAFVLGGLLENNEDILSLL